MGVWASRQNGGVEELDIAPNHAYRYPPKSGCYFGSYFIMGGERFESTQPEAYLFGENQDLNFLGARPLPFPYPAPQSNEPTKTIKSLVNVRKDSLRLVKLSDDDAVGRKDGPDATSHKLNSTAGSKDGVSLKCDVSSPDDEGLASAKRITSSSSAGNNRYNVEFTFDADARCAITLYYFATESIDGQHAIYVPRDPEMNSETYRYKAGANQQFVQTTHVIQPGRFSDDDWHMVGGEKDIIPIVIQCVVEDEEDHLGHSHMTFACIEKTSDGFAIKALKQKQMVDGLCYLLQEIYGIENKKAHVDASKGGGDGGGDGGCDEDPDDNGSECVICMSDVRDTLILPCRHLCLCNGCADSLRYQANNCPICRAPFRALLQIRAMRKKTDSMEVSPDVECPISQEGCPPGYEAISLIEALNGPATPTHRVLSSDGGVGTGSDAAAVGSGGEIGVGSGGGASAGVPQSRSSAMDAPSGGGGGAASGRAAHRSKRRTSSARAGSGRGSGRSTMGSPRVNPEPSQTTPSTTPLLHHCASPPSDASPALSAIPLCRSVEDEGDFAIVSIPARRARIAKMGEDVESLGSAMSESPSIDAVVTRPISASIDAPVTRPTSASIDAVVTRGDVAVTRPTSASFPVSSDDSRLEASAIDASTVDAAGTTATVAAAAAATAIEIDDDDEDAGAATPAADNGAASPASATTPVAPVPDDVVMNDAATDLVETVGTNPRSSMTPVAADV